MTFPEFNRLDLTQEPLWHGYYSLGMIEKYRPDIRLIDFRLRRRDCWQDSDRNILLLQRSIEQDLAQNKKVLLVPWEEDFMGQQEDSITDCFNQYANEDFWLVSEMDYQGQDIFRRYHELKCKILELPFVITNDAIVYAKIRKNFDPGSAPRSGLSYLCMVGRPEKHKFDLLIALKNYNLHDHGHLTFMDANFLNNRELLSFAKPNITVPKYHLSKLSTSHRKEAAQIEIAGIWASSNVENFLHIESTYDMPLIINPESTMGIFPATEKSIWPALLGRLYLIQAQSGIMKYIQQFHDVDQHLWANLEFDSIHGWDQQAHDLRRQTMISKNRELIQDSTMIYAQLREALEQSRWSFAERMYRFFCRQIMETI